MINSPNAVDQMNPLISYRTITVWLQYKIDKKIHPYFCPNCRNVVMTYGGDVVMEMPGEHPNNMPFVVQCKNPNCKTRYHFIGFVKEI
jgi:RNase P subunit RPR2